MKQLTIEHNHGHLTLADVTVTEVESCGYKFKNARGTVVDGGVTNRLFHATSYTPYPVGQPMDRAIYGTPRCVDEAKDHWYISQVFCG